MASKLILSVLLAILILPLGTATELTLRTLGGYDTSIFIQDPTTNYLIESFHQNAGPNGRVEISFSTTKDTVDALVKIKINGNELFSERFESLDTSEAIEIELPDVDECDPEHLSLCLDEEECNTDASGFWYDGKCNAEECTNAHLDLCSSEPTCIVASGFWYNSVCNSEPSPEPIPEEIPEEVAEETSGILTGFSIFGEGEEPGLFKNKIFWFIIGGLIVIAFIAIYAKHKLAMPVIPKNAPKLSHGSKILEHELTHTERKLREAQAEINKLKNKGKIDEAKKKVEEDREHLRRLERGEI